MASKPMAAAPAGIHIAPTRTRGSVASEGRPTLGPMARLTAIPHGEQGWR